MKRFRDFIAHKQKESKDKTKQNYSLVLAQPSHGKHSEPPTTKHITEAVGEHGPHHSDMDSWVEDNQNHHLGKTHRDVKDKLVESAPKFNKTELEHSHEYTKSSHYLNKDLIAKASGAKRTLSHDNKTSVKHLDAALHSNKAKLKHEVHVYHGIKHWHPGEEARKNNGYVKIPTYLSTSTNKYVAHRFSDRHILHIHMKPGDKGRYVDHISKHRGEHEMLLPRNTVLKLHPRNQKVGDHTIWHATIHSQDKED